MKLCSNLLDIVFKMEARNVWDNEHVIDMFEDYAKEHNLKYERNTPYRNCPSSFIHVYFGGMVTERKIRTYPDSEKIIMDRTWMTGQFGHVTYGNSGRLASSGVCLDGVKHEQVLKSFVDDYQVADYIEGTWVFR